MVFCMICHWGSAQHRFRSTCGNGQVILHAATVCFRSSRLDFDQARSLFPLPDTELRCDSALALGEPGGFIARCPKAQPVSSCHKGLNGTRAAHTRDWASDDMRRWPISPCRASLLW